MPNIKSAIKRVDVAERNRQRNIAYKSMIKTFTKKFMTRLGEYAQSPSEAVLTEVQALLNQTFSRIDKAIKAGVIHTNTGARKKSRLDAALRTALAKAQAKAG
ncbi:30S ribosomal protein S20 [Gloeobacter violaceus]|uniref:Small ribosomal subunit protein bS20 n=1 Tax=Gloeobacter violaceus (strain ATCC 29082 / PCC 7421) TaxID=251221 RepID=RS20_GLOVI|nr:30S ribosomal protein S20 [Gloeobacter violaceus]Q7NP97.1 RecName: Full=Small ribosomal subunit protein bS20; AltName: Full=30S ribosomal protein S20 [Gloeobacter violaceus PCC 7421]BAC88101.1 30S ribosomal protein S20 [Gloeobacter violaceus PCC 7421]